MACPNCDECRLYHVLNQDEKRSDLIADICMDEDEYKSCQRYIRMSDGEKVPPTLMPDGSDLRKGTSS